MRDEKNILIEEWLQYAKDDLESAKVILKETDNYHISVYHSHQAIEKLFKWFLLKNNHKFQFIHDIKELYRLVSQLKKTDIFEDIYYIDDLYPLLRYPTGEKITNDEAKKSLKIAEKIFDYFTD